MHLGQGIIVLGRGTAPPGRCPRGYETYKSKGGNIRSTGSHRYPEWSCMPPPPPPPVRAAPPPPPRITVSPRFNVSPAIQTQVSPQISPAFQQIQDSPYASTRAAPSQRSQAPQTASNRVAIENARAELALEQDKIKHELDIAQLRRDADRARGSADSRDDGKDAIDTFLKFLSKDGAQESDIPAPISQPVPTQTAFTPQPTVTRSNELTLPIQYPEKEKSFLLPLALGGAAITLFLFAGKKAR